MNPSRPMSPQPPPPLPPPPGGELETATVTMAVPFTDPLEAVTVKGPPGVAPAVKSPAAVIVPPPLTFQAKLGVGLIRFPNWSIPSALNAWEPPGATVTELGETRTVERTGALEVTLTCAVALWPPPVAVTVKGPPALPPAVNRPATLIVPPPLTLQAKVGGELMGFPN